MPLDESRLIEASSLIIAAERILIAAHIRPDGDAVGSLLGLGLVLEQSGHDVQMVIDDGIPASLRHLEGSARVTRKPTHDVDLYIAVDCSDPERLGSLKVNRGNPDINIDHHMTNPLFGKLNLVDGDAAATSEIIFQIIQKLELPLSPGAAAALLTGIITDTIGFRTSNVRPLTLQIAAALMETGVNMPELYMRALIDRSFESVKFWGNGFSKLKKDGRLVWTALTQEDRLQAGYPGKDDADLINFLASIEGADIALVFVEQPNGNTKVSWRSKEGFNVARLAAELGGGGHPAAAGAEVAGSINEVQNEILEKTRSVIFGGNGV